MKNIVITGSGRSGTSLAGGLFAKSGYFMGEKLYVGIESNPKGFFESPDINAINEELLAAALQKSHHEDSSLGYGQRWLARLPLGEHISATEEVLHRIQVLTDRKPICFKDPRFAFTLDVWRPFLGEVVFLCIFRDPATTVASILRECEVRKDYLSDILMTQERATELWTNLYRWVLEVQSSEGDWHFIHYDQLLEEEMQRNLEAWTGAKVDDSFPDGNLSRSGPTVGADPDAETLYRELCRRASYSLDTADQLRRVIYRQQSSHQRELDILLKSLAFAEQQVHELGTRGEELETLARAARVTAEKEQAENSALRLQVESIYRSRSWRLAGPFRRIARVIRALTKSKSRS